MCIRERGRESGSGREKEREREWESWSVCVGDKKSVIFLCVWGEESGGGTCKR